ncbi:hypothetical protein C6Q21_03800 [Burkholderia multivorans]|nr:hypothetical protein C6Q08_16480 [Burkholderia multivorans]PRG13778.1 hypothetical protein C6Q21_03800 [Burkholderia multivorans]PRH33431.1 hypothetical protein C6T53_00070 [Burkholderia multivorans]
MACRRGAVGGAAGFDAASLDFGCPTKHPARRQAPLFDTQHCGGATRRDARVAVVPVSALPAARRRTAAHSGRPRACPPLYKRHVAPNLF